MTKFVFILSFLLLSTMGTSLVLLRIFFKAIKDSDPDIEID
jgi:hypothetical protein